MLTRQLLFFSPPPQGLWWEVNDVGALEIKWTEGDLMPQELIDIRVHTLARDDEEDEEIPELDNVVYWCVFISNACALLQY